ncbi:MAG: 16S rRNA (cytosine(1402)-N(4))-methyltransferase, partial [Akkermansia sp.]|nr:16S rRNA (cytosine(1402)-N(4))-methyltransferase [Akkermansia sp.]
MNREATIVRATGARPGGSCYRVLMWEEGALSDEELEAWQKERAALLTRMRDAGVKGARGTLAGLERELRELSTRAVEAPLATRGGARVSRTRAEALAQTLAQEPGLLGYRITGNSADILLELTGEEGVDALLRRWAEATPGTVWCKNPLIQVLQAAEAQERLAALEEEAPAEDETDDTADDTPFHHVTVLAHEAVEALQPAEGRVMVDATLGGGGHSELLLQAG